LLRPKKDERCPPFEELIAGEEKRDLEEHWRLLYVALTRAADRLIVSGVRPKERKDGADPRPVNCWHRTVEQAMGAVNSESGKGHVALRYGSRPEGRSARPKEKVALAPIVVPPWATAPAPPEARPPRPLAPSAIAVDDEASAPPSETLLAAARRGILIHQLLERLADVEPAERRERALAWLERSAGLADEAQRREITDQVCGVLSDSRFARLFGPGSLAEAPLAATLTDGRVIAGTADRLLVEERRVSVLDFKTGRVPVKDADIPAAHRAQMQAYADALRIIFPGRDICAALLYTSGPKLIEVMP
jgi:ATP-dependent helicase/nuclease subunit A